MMRIMVLLIQKFKAEDGMTLNIDAVNNIISLEDLAGLQYYNMGIDLYNQGKFDKAFTNIQKANFLYPSKRIKEMHRIFRSQAVLVTSN